MSHFSCCMSHWCAVVVRGTLTVKAKLSKVVSVEMSDVYQVGFNAVITVNERERDFYESNGLQPVKMASTFATNVI